MDEIFIIKDKSGRDIYLTEEGWKHIAKEHPVISNKIEEIKETVIKPLTIKESKYDSNVRFYYRYYKNIKLKAKYLMVVVKYLNGKGFIITSFYVNRIK